MVGGGGSYSSFPSISMYKPNTKIEFGSAVNMKYSAKVKSVFIEMSKQKGDKLPPGVTGYQFDWANKITVKISQMEMAKMLQCFKGHVKVVDMFHSTDKSGSGKGGTAFVKLEKDNELGKTYLRVGRKEPDGTYVNYQFMLDLNECYMVEKFLEKSLEQTFGFGNSASAENKFQN